MNYYENRPFIIISLLQTVFVFFFYGGLNIPLGLFSLTITFLFCYFKRDVFFLLNCVFTVAMLLVASSNQMLSNSAILLFLASSVWIYYSLKSFGSLSGSKNYQVIILMLVGIAYGISAIHKMNVAFFEAPYSCAIHYFNMSLKQVNISADLSWINAKLPWIVVGVELFLGIGFFIKRWRTSSFYLMAFLHFVSSVGNPTVEPFGCLMITLVTLAFWGEENTKRSPDFFKLVIAGVFIIAMNFFLKYLEIVSVNYVPGLFTILLIFFLYRSGLPATMKEKQFLFSLKSFILPLAYFLFCLGPYTGIRETGTMDMYSNLIPASQGTNHYFMGKIIPKMINPWNYRIKIYSIGFGGKTLFFGQEIVVADHFDTKLNQLLEGLEFDKSRLELKLNLFGKKFEGNYPKAHEKIEAKNSIFFALLARIVAPHPIENLKDTMKSCEW